MTDDTFAGDLSLAKARLLRLARLANDELDAEKLNLLSFHCAAYIDAKHQSGQRVRQFQEELAKERSEIDASPRNSTGR